MTSFYKCDQMLPMGPAVTNWTRYYQYGHDVRFFTEELTVHRRMKLIVTGVTGNQSDWGN